VAIVAAIGSAIATVGAYVTLVGELALGAALGGSAAAFAIADFVVPLALGLGAIAAISAIASLFSPKTNLGGGVVTFKADPAAGLPYVIGRAGVGGNIVFADTSNDGKNTWLHYITVLSAGPVDAIESFTANNVPVTFDASTGAATQLGYNWRSTYSGATQYQINDGVSYLGSIYICVATPPGVGHDPSDTNYWAAAGSYAGPRWLSRMWQLFSKGPQPASALPAPAGTGSVPEWGSSNQLSGLAASRWVLQADSAAFPTGTPKPLWVVRGKPVYDPRLDSTFPGGSGSQRAADPTTWVFSRNPFLHALTWLIGVTANGQRVLGLGAPITAIDVAAFVTGANVADANGWTVGGQVFSTDSKWDVLLGMLQAGCGAPARIGAMISCIVNTPRVSIATLTGADITAAASVPGTVARRDRINRVIPTYQSEPHEWQLVPAEPIVVTDYIAADGGQRTKSIRMPLVQDVNHAAQLARYAIEDAREFGPITLPLKPQWLGLQPGDCITINEPELGLNSQDVLVLGRKIDAGQGAPTLMITARSETSAKHAFALGQTGTAPPQPTLTGVDFYAGAPASPPWTAIGATISNAGVDTPAIVVTGMMENPAASDLIVRYRLHAGPGTWNYYGAPPAPVATRIEITSLASGAAYDIGLSYLVRGVQGTELVISNVTAGAFSGGGGGSSVTPATIEWTDISASGGVPTTGSTNTQTISGITSAVVFQVNWTGTATLSYVQNSGAPVSITSGGTLTVSNGDTLAFVASDSTAGTNTGIITVINNTDSGATIDAPAYSLTVSTTITDGTVLYDSSTPGSFSYTVVGSAPGFVDIEEWGPGAIGANGTPTGFGGYVPGAGGGGGGYVKKHISVTPGTTAIAGVIGAPGTNSTVTSPALTAGAASGTSGGTASGGDTNTSGSGSGTPYYYCGGGAGNGGGAQTVIGGNGTAPGGGGAGGFGAGPGGFGANGRVRITARTT